MTPRDPITDKHVGQLVTYYRNGWRFARLAELTPKVAVLQRDGKNTFKVPISDVKGIEA